MEEDIGHVTWWAKMYSLVAKMEAIKVRIAGMETFNRFRAIQGYTEGYSESEFYTAERELMELSEELAKI